MCRVNAFDWKSAFPKILTGEKSGFDAVIGNPPYGIASARQSEYAQAAVSK